MDRAERLDKLRKKVWENKRQKLSNEFDISTEIWGMCKSLHDDGIISEFLGRAILGLIIISDDQKIIDLENDYRQLFVSNDKNIGIDVVGRGVIWKQSLLNHIRNDFGKTRKNMSEPSITPPSAAAKGPLLNDPLNDPSADINVKLYSPLRNHVVGTDNNIYKQISVEQVRIIKNSECYSGKKGLCWHCEICRSYHSAISYVRRGNTVKFDNLYRKYGKCATKQDSFREMTILILVHIIAFYCKLATQNISNFHAQNISNFDEEIMCERDLTTFSFQSIFDHQSVQNVCTEVEITYEQFHKIMHDEKIWPRIEAAIDVKPPLTPEEIENQLKINKELQDNEVCDNI